MVALLQKEDGAEIVKGLYTKAVADEIALKMNRLNLLEVYYGCLREYGKEKTDELFKKITESPIQVISEFSDAVFEEAGRLKATYRISLADSVALAEACVHNGTLVTSDHHEFDVIEQNESIHFLWIR